jgi:hypothetical protein
MDLRISCALILSTLTGCATEPIKDCPVCPPPVPSLPPQIAASLSLTEAAVGDPVRYVVAVLNAGDTRPLPPSFGDLKATEVPVAKQSTMTLRSGEFTQTVARVYTWTFRPEHEGEITLGPASLTVGGRTLQSKPVTLKVVSGPSRSVESPPLSGDVLAVASLDQVEIPVAGHVTYTLSVTAPAEGVIVQTPGWGDLTVLSAQRSTTTETRTLHGQTRMSKVFAYTWSLTATRAGEYTIAAPVYMLSSRAAPAMPLTLTVK